MERRVFMQSLAAIGIVPKSALSRTEELHISRIADWWCDLNQWKWPSDWGRQPDWITAKFALPGRECYEYEKQRYSRIMDGLIEVCGDREASRVHNVIRRKAMSESQFSEWYGGAISPPPPSVTKIG